VKKKSRRKRENDDLRHFKAVRSYINRVSTAKLGKHHYFSLCVRASISKCYEFNMLARTTKSPEDAFFAIASLRGICEDLIVLRFIKGMPKVDREALIIALAGHETATRVKLQAEFFKAFRPQQPVLQLQDPDQAIAVRESEAQAVWNRHGWPNLRSGAMPQIRQIAEKQGAPYLLILYDYFYRLTSSGVHFNVQSLMRSGWGDVPEVRFSTKNFHSYFSSFCTIYGAFMFCLYFEFFGQVLRPGSKVMKSVAEIRKTLLFTPRWPEMVTYEEMNLRPPKMGTASMILSALQAAMRKRLIGRGIDYRNKGSSERKFAAWVFKKFVATNPNKPNAKPGSS
jgi:hypothetical protein